MDIPVIVNQDPSTPITSSATNATLQFEHFAASIGCKEPHAPHSPSASSDTPPNLILHSGHESLSKGMIARQAPHSAIGASAFSSSDIWSHSVYGRPLGDIMVHGPEASRIQ